MSQEDDKATAARRVDRSALEGETARFSIGVEGSPDAPLVVAPSDARARAFVGTSSTCDLVIDDPLVSRRHLALSVDGGLLRLSDLGSTNGTRVGEVDVVEARLRGGETIRIGDTRLNVRSLGESESAPVRLPTGRSFGRLIGESPEMRRLYPLMARLAMSDVPVILEGETGTGKELLAEAIHEASPRAGGPYVVFDCTTGPASLLESMLFGQERGAFTGAVASRPGVFEQAHGGTLLIDEIGDLDVSLQAKLLRAIQRKEVQRLGSTRWVKVDVRIMAATRRDLEREIQEGRFRDDLYYRLAVARVELPPLRRRTGEVAVLARHFWRQLGGEGEPATALLDRLETYSWPGNVRELHNAVSHEVALGELADQEGLRRPTSIVPVALEPEPRDPFSAVLAEKLPYPRAREKVIAMFDERFVEHVLAEHGGNVTKAAASSGIARRYFYKIRARSKPSP